MNILSTTNVICSTILIQLLASQVIADPVPIESMSITGGSVVWTAPGGAPEEDIFYAIGPETNLVGGYIGVGGSTLPPFVEPDPDNIAFFTFLGGMNTAVTYTALSNLGTEVFPADTMPGGPVPTGTVDDTQQTIEMDLSSWFVNYNNYSDVWAGTGLDDGYTSQTATGTWNPETYEYELSWDSMSPYNPFPGLLSTWTLTGYAYPESSVVIITIDIKPGSDPNSINIGSSGVIPVAILSTADFDAATVDPTSVSLAGASVKLVGKSDKYLCHEEDVNYDGLNDLVCQIYTAQFFVEEGATTAVLEAETFDGTELRGEDSIRIVPDI